MPRVEFEPTISLFERAKTVHGRAGHCDRLTYEKLNKLFIIRSKIAAVCLRMCQHDDVVFFQHAINCLPTQTVLNSADNSREHRKCKCGVTAPMYDYHFHNVLSGLGNEIC
jgi:hypothetical protein